MTLILAILLVVQAPCANGSCPKPQPQQAVYQQTVTYQQVASCQQPKPKFKLFGKRKCR